MNVLHILAARKARADKHESYDDGYKLGLAVEGGGMRGIVSGAMVNALQDMGYLELFDSYYGSSSGCGNLAYTLAGQGNAGLSIYYEWLARKEFIKPSRVMRGHSIMNIPYVRTVLTELQPLDTHKLMRYRGRLVFPVANLTLNEGELHHTFASTNELMDYLIAAMQIPVLGGKPVMIDGQRYVDGGLFYVDPFYAPMQDGCTHILTLYSRLQNTFPTRIGNRTRLSAHAINALGTDAGDIYIQKLRTYIRDSAEMGFGASVKDGVHIYRHTLPAGAHEATRMTIDSGILLEAARVGYQSIVDMLGDGRQQPVYFAFTTHP
jgi:predicted patatin/cPLA2 family phospholipase